MKLPALRSLYLFVFLCLLQSCANVVAPQGGEIDKQPPRLVSVTPKDSLLNTKVSKIELRFDEYITVTDVANNVHISPLLLFPLNVQGLNKKVTVKIPDTLLTGNTTYRITFGNAIKDLNEGNPFPAYSYTFSTGSYFDSLKLRGAVINAATGLHDTGAFVLLYDAAKSDSIIVREKPMYIVKADNAGNFSFEGLPNRSFKIFALNDANNNMMYDGNGESVAFADMPVAPDDSGIVKLFIFTEKDTNAKKAASATTETKSGKANRTTTPETNTNLPTVPYNVGLDTGNIKNRSFDITAPILVHFNIPVSAINNNRINLSFDSAGVNVEAPLSITRDTARNETKLSTTHWQQNSIYTLRLLKGFAKDTAGNDLLPSKYTFRTKQEEDYGKLHIHLPAKYHSSDFLFVLLKDNDSIYQKPVTDTMIHFTYLKPGSYTLRIIVDKNKNGIWDTGDLLGRKQPEEVIPYPENINLKPGWENLIDFDQKPTGKGRFNTPPNGR